MNPETKRLTKKEARVRLAAFLDELTLDNRSHLHHPASMIGKAIFYGLDLGLTLDGVHAVVRSHLRKHEVRHQLWWTKSVAQGAWERAKQRQEENSQHA